MQINKRVRKYQRFAVYFFTEDGFRAVTSNLVCDLDIHKTSEVQHWHGSLSC